MTTSLELYEAFAAEQERMARPVFDSLGEKAAFRVDREVTIFCMPWGQLFYVHGYSPMPLSVEDADDFFGWTDEDEARRQEVIAKYRAEVLDAVRSPASPITKSSYRRVPKVFDADTGEELHPYD